MLGRRVDRPYVQRGPRWRRHRLAPAVVGLAVAALFAPVAASSASASPFFAPSSVWNLPLASNAQLDPSSGALVAELQRQRLGWGSWINTTSGSTPIYTVPRAQPRVRVKLDGASAPLLAGALGTVPVPAGAKPAAGGDGNVLIWQPSTDTIWEFWRMSKHADGWHARWGGRMYDVSRSPGHYRERKNPDGSFFERRSWGAPATSLSLAGGVMTIAELRSGHIDHALYVSIPQPRKGMWAWPAQRTDGTRDSSVAIPEGAHFRIDPNLDLRTLNLPPVTRMMAVAAQRYGIVINNISYSVSFRAEDPSPTGSDPYPALFGNRTPKDLLAYFPWGRLQLLKMDLRRS